MSIITGFRANRWSNISIHEDTGIYVNGDLRECSMRPNQKHVFDQYGNERYFIMEEPAGAGKSTTIKFVFANELRKNPERKLIIVIPQTFISKSFGRVFLRYDDNSLIEWDISRNLCQNTPDNKIDGVVQFLRKTKFNEGIQERILITTHMAMAKVYEHISNEFGLFKNSTIVIDEAHHVLYPENGFTECANKIGKLVGHIIEEYDPTTKIWFPTATFYRGDKATILPEEVMNQFTRYFLPLDKHWENNIQHIKSFSFDFIVYKDSPFKEIKSLIRKEKTKTIIFCPYQGHLINNDKYEFKNQLVSEIYKVWPDANIIDLVDEYGREDRKEIIYDDAKAKDIDIILSVKIFDEGSDWKFAERVIDLTPTNSLRVQGQRNGRLWRDCDGKSHIAYYMFLPFISRMLDEENFRKKLSENYTAFIASLLVQDTIQPIVIHKEISSTNTQDTHRVNWFVSEIPDPAKRSQIIDVIIKRLIVLRNISDNVPIEKIKECIERTISDFGIENHLEEIAVYIVKMLRRSMIPNYNVDISWMLEEGFDKIWKHEIFDKLLSFGTKIAGIKTFYDFRKIYDSRKTLEEFVQLAETLAKENDGVLPNPRWLSVNGHDDLRYQMKIFPDAFAHILQKSLIKTTDERVKEAEILAKENGGKLPCVVWLVKNGRSAIVSSKRLHPEKYAHIEQEIGHNNHTFEEWMEIAKQLIKDNNGILPSQKWLKDHDLNGLNYIIYKDEFKKIYDVKKMKEMMLIAQAEELAVQNNGILPSQKWLRENKFSKIASMNPTKNEKLKHLKQDGGKHRNTHDILMEAQKLAEENGGILPSNEWLIKNEKRYIIQSINRNKEKFQHIKRESSKEMRLQKYIEKNVALAKKIANENGGILPSYNSLIKNGNQPLVVCIRKFKSKFKSIPKAHIQEYKVD